MKKKIKKIDKKEKIYRLLDIHTAMNLLRPGAKWEISGNTFTRWNDPRPCPTINEVYDTMDKIKFFEDSIDTIYLPEQLEQMGIKDKNLDES